MKPHKTTTVGTAVEKYELVVTYHPYSQDERKNILSGTKVQQPDAEKGGTPVNSNLKATGNYVVNVVAGNIQIIKELDGAAEKDETFNFTITDGVIKQLQLQLQRLKRRSNSNSNSGI